MGNDVEHYSYPFSAIFVQALAIPLQLVKSSGATDTGTSRHYLLEKMFDIANKALVIFYSYSINLGLGVTAYIIIKHVINEKNKRLILDYCLPALWIFKRISKGCTVSTIDEMK